MIDGRIHDIMKRAAASGSGAKGYHAFFKGRGLPSIFHLYSQLI